MEKNRDAMSVTDQHSALQSKKSSSQLIADSFHPEKQKEQLDPTYIEHAFQEQVDLSIQDILQMDTPEMLQEEVFIILNQHEINSSKKQFWESYANNTSKADTFRFVQIKRSDFVHNENKNLIIQFIDISKSILYDQVKAEI